MPRLNPPNPRPQLPPRKLYQSSGGYILGTWWPDGKRGWLHAAQGEPYLLSLLIEVEPEDGEVDDGFSLSALNPPSPERLRVSGSVNRGGR